MQRGPGDANSTPLGPVPSSPFGSGGSSLRNPPRESSSSSRPPFGPCSDCGGPHDFDYCPRNRNGHRFVESAERYLGTGKAPPRAPKLEGDTRQVRRLTVDSYGAKEIRIPLRVGRLDVWDGLADTGSHITFMDSAFYMQHRHQFPHPLQAKPRFEATDAGGKPMPITGTLWVNVTATDALTGRTLTRLCDIYVVRHLATPLLLGMDLLNRFYNTINLQTGTGTLISPARLPAEIYALRLAQDVTLPPHSYAEVRVRFDAAPYVEVGSTVHVSPLRVTGDRHGRFGRLRFPEHLRIQAGQKPGKVEYTLLIWNADSEYYSFQADAAIGEIAVVAPSQLDTSFSKEARHLRQPTRKGPLAPTRLETDFDVLCRLLRAGAPAVPPADPLQGGSPMDTSPDDPSPPQAPSASASSSSSSSSSSSAPVPEIPMGDAAPAATPLTDAEVEDIVRGCDINPALSASDRQQFEKVIRECARASAFADAAPPRPAVGVVHEIHLSNPAPLKQRAYRASPLKEKVISDTTRKLLAQGLITHSQSAWSSPVSLVPKHNGEMRMVIDYRRVNAQTIKDAYPIPLIEDCLNVCQNADFLSLIDIKDAYHHIEVALQARGITAFVTHEGLFEWKRMPFGLSNAPATFQRYVDMMLRDLIGKICAAFFDDCLVHSTGPLSVHLADVRKVLLRLASCNLQANFKKCKFGYKELLFVGHIISKGTLRPDPEKIRAVTEFPRPTGLTQLKSFLGLANYYHRYIPGFSKIAAPLYRLTRKAVPFDWSQEAILAFEDLKKALTSAPCLYAPNFRLPFIVQTDASKEGIGAVLVQQVDGEEHPVAYISRQLNKHEQNYSPTEWECLAVVWATGQFEHFLVDAPFTIVTDHAALQWLPTKRFQNARLMRWALALSEFSYTIQHRGGTANANADALSRSPLEHTAPSLDGPDPDAGKVAPSEKTPHFVRCAHLSCIPFDELPESHHVMQVQQQGERAKAEDGEVEWTLVNLSDLEVFGNAQREQADLQPLFGFLEHKHLPASFSKSDQDRLRRAAANYVLIPHSTCKHPLLYYQPAAPRRGFMALHPPTPRLVVPGSQRKGLLHLFHDMPTGGHYGVKGTFRKLYQAYYWDTLLTDVEAHVRACTICQTLKVQRRKLSAIPKRPEEPSRPWELVSMDYVGPFRTARQRSPDFEYILVAVDHFTHYAITIPMQRCDSASTARALMDELFCRHGVPARLIMDRGSSFNNALMLDVQKSLGISPHFTTAYHPQANGMVERLNGTLKELLRTLNKEVHGEWVEMLQAVTFSYNTKVSEATGFTPYFLVHGREAVTPATALAEAALADSDNPQDAPSYADDLISTVRDSHRFVNERLTALRASLTDRQNAIARTPGFNIGDCVYLANHKVDKQGKYIAVPESFKGPYVITEKTSDVTYLVQPYGKHRGLAKGPKTAHIEQLKPFDQLPHPTPLPESPDEAAPVAPPRPKGCARSKPPPPPTPNPVPKVHASGRLRDASLAASVPELTFPSSAPLTPPTATTKPAIALPRTGRRGNTGLGAVTATDHAELLQENGDFVMIPSSDTPAAPTTDAYTALGAHPPEAASEQAAVQAAGVQGPAAAALGRRRAAPRVDYYHAERKPVDPRPAIRYSRPAHYTLPSRKKAKKDGEEKEDSP